MKKEKENSKDSPSPTTMKDEIPLRDQRQLCYQSRDAFFTCCDKNNIENPLKAVDAVQRSCKREKQKFDRDCIDSWVHGFRGYLLI